MYTVKVVDALRTMRVKRKPDNIMTTFEKRSESMKRKKLTINPPKRILPTVIGRGMLGGDEINNR